MESNCEDLFKVLVYVIGIYVVLRIVQSNCDIGLGNFFQSVEQFVNTPAPAGSVGMPAAAEPGSNEGFKKVKGLGRTPSTCYPQPELKADDLLPKEDSQAIQEFNLAKPVGEGILKGINLLDAGYHVGVNTIGQSLRNANLQLRSEPPNPQVNVSPWQNSTIGPDLIRRPLEDGEGCAASAGPASPASDPAGAP